MGRPGRRRLPALLLASCAAVMAACDDGRTGNAGGQGAGGAQPSVTTAAPAPARRIAGKDMTAFVAGRHARYIVMRNRRLSQGPLEGATQDTTGVYRAIAGLEAVNGTQFQAVAGNTDFAMGSWAGGRVTNTADGTTVDSPWGVNYAVYNRASALPADATLACKPLPGATRSQAGMPGTLAASATLSIDNGIAHASVSMKLKTAAGTIVAMNGSGTFGPLDFELVMDGGLGSGVGIALGDAANGGHVLIAPWRVVEGPGSHDGVAVFTCERQYRRMP